MNKSNAKIRTLRTTFNYKPLEEKKIDKNPYIQFNSWMEDAIKAKAIEPNSMTLATVNKKGFPDARIVLLRGVGKNGFSFFTNYKSAKGRELSNRKACLNFFWAEISRQVRIIGNVKKLSAKESDDYFNSRPRESQISAWTSHQSEVVAGRFELENKYLHMEKKFQNKKVPRPSYWGGYAVLPISIEFWQGKQNRLHDRILFSKLKTGKWKIERISP
ncbi:pyridoxamine 5'-phosphate oxidase [soil metagenome]